MEHRRVSIMHRILALVFLGLPIFAQAPAQPQAPAPQAPAAPPQAPAAAPQPPRQTAPAQQEPGVVITSTTQEVIVPVTVTDDKGRFVSNLTAKDFRILDEGRPQRITYYNHEGKQSIVVGFLVDL